MDRVNKIIRMIRNKGRKLTVSLARTIFPTDIYCICCGSIIDSTRAYSLCDSCIEKFQWIGTDACSKCGKPLGKDDRRDLCFDCRTKVHYFDKGHTCCLYDLYARAVVMDLKYRDKSYLGRIVGEIMADRMKAEIGAGNSNDVPDKEPAMLKRKYDLVIPVPVSPERMEERGYNQAAIIAAEFAEKTGIVMDGEFLVREDRKMAMKDLNAMQRRLNVKDAFSVTEHGKELLDHSYGDCDDVKTNAKNILLIDDIYTTGSTVDECARVLKEAGAGRVDVLTFAAGANRVPGERAGRTARSCDN